MRKAIVVATLLMCVPVLAWGASTRENRDDSLVFVGISPVGLHVPTLLTFPVGVGLYLGESWMIGVEYGSFEVDVEDDGDEADGTFDNAGAYVRWFPGNSFYVTLAAHQRNWEANATVTVTEESTGTQRTLQARLETEATVATLGLGNQWMADFGLVFGVDWVLLSGLVDDSSVGSFDEGELASLTDPADREQAEQDLADLGDLLNDASGFPGVLVVTIGWAF